MAPSSGSLAAAALLLTLTEGHSTVNSAFPTNYYEHNERTGYVDGCWVPAPFPEHDRCGMQGFCLTPNLDDLSYWECDCFYGYAGPTCAVDLWSDRCSDYDCGEEYQGMCVLDNEYEPKCSCHAEWRGQHCLNPTEPLVNGTVPTIEDVTFETVKEDRASDAAWNFNEGDDTFETSSDTQDFCAGVKCNNKGTCIYAPERMPKFQCVCEIGWGGPHCGQELEECEAIFLLEMFARLIDYGKDMALECGYSKPILFSDANSARSNDDYFPFCICADHWRDNLPDDYDHYKRTCRMDMFRDIPFGAEADTYCPGCTDTQDAIMEDFLTSFNNICYHFVFERGTMPLYWRSIWKCFCMNDLTVATAQTVITCPFQKHASQDDFISYENCANDRVCDWTEMYRYFEEDFSLINMEGSKICKEWLEGWMFTVPGEARFETFDGTLCPCLEALRANCNDCDDILDCIPVTFHQLTVRETYDQICYDRRILNRDCVNWINYIAIQLAHDDFSAAASCYAALDLFDSGLEPSENLMKLMCFCVGTTVELYGGDDDYVRYALSCIPDFLSLDLSRDCPHYDGPSMHIPVPTPKPPNQSEDRRRSVKDSLVAPEEKLGRGPKAARFARYRRRTEDSDVSYRLWRTITLVEVPVIIILFCTSIFLIRQKKMTNEKLAAEWPQISG